MDDDWQMEVAARLSLLQNLLEHILAEQLAGHPRGADALAVLRDAVLGSLTMASQFSRPTTDDERENYTANVEVIGRRFFARTEELRAQLAAFRAGRR